MLRHYYYINGERVSEDQYIASKAKYEYEKFAMERAKEYYKSHKLEWDTICYGTPEHLLTPTILYHFEKTPEGKECLKAWQAKVKRSKIFMYIIVGIMITAFLIAAISICTGHSN